MIDFILEIFWNFLNIPEAHEEQNVYRYMYL
jgi:hypothetical protein